MPMPVRSADHLRDRSAHPRRFVYLDAKIDAVLRRLKVGPRGGADVVSERYKASVHVEVEAIPSVLTCLWVTCSA
jgi:hypothetical protein